MANPRQVGTLTEIRTTEWGTDYAITFDDGDAIWSDLRQNGWRRVSSNA
jgi:hypothetical protein